MLAPSVGDRFGPYEIAGRLGEGGMGVVYRARDTRLGREVALKFLSHSSHGEPAFASRFEQEARALAALNHPHIAAIHDVIDVGDHRAIVMELVAGESLAQCMAAGPLPLRVALGYGIDVSDALSAAHTAGIVHRDLKPANIMITTAGEAKVLDFGIAKVMPADESATAAPLTQERVAIGTAGYMAPEQAHGRPADARSDIFSLGAVLYEAISGRRAFEGDTMAALVSAVIRDDPPRLGTLVPAIPRAVERCVMRCLDKDPGRRYQSAGDLEIVLEDLRDDLATTGAGPAREVEATSPAAPARRMRRALAYAGIAVAIAATGFVSASVLAPRPFQTPRYRPFITEVTSVENPSWSPDGRTLAYVDFRAGQWRIFVRAVDALQSTELTSDPVSATQPPIWAPDGSRIYFVRARDGLLVSVGAGGGEPQPVAGAYEADEPTIPRRVCLSPDGRTIVFTRVQPDGLRLWALEIGTSSARPLESAGLPYPFVTVQSLAFSPDGTRLAVVASTSALNQSRGIWLVAWPGGSVRRLLADAPYLAQGFAIGWMPDSRRLVMSGSPQHGGPSRLLLVDTAEDTAMPLTGGIGGEISPAVSPDGTRIAFILQRSGMDLIQFPVDGGPPEPLVATSRTELYPDMSASGLLAYITDADGSSVVRLRSSGDTWSRAMTGANESEQQGATPAGEVRLSRDGRRAAVGSAGAEHVIWIYATAGGTPTRLDRETTDQHGPSWSPDGNWIAYRRMVNATWSIVKAPLGGGAVVRLDDASAGGGATDWSSTGDWIAHAMPDGVHLVSPDGAARRVLAGLVTGAFRFSRDGSRLFAVRRGQDRRWELTTWDVAAGRELRAVALPVASAAQVAWLALSPDETRIIVSAGINTSDIWLLEQFASPLPWWTRWLSGPSS